MMRASFFDRNRRVAAVALLSLLLHIAALVSITAWLEPIEPAQKPYRAGLRVRIQLRALSPAPARAQSPILASPTMAAANRADDSVLAAAVAPISPTSAQPESASLARPEEAARPAPDTLRINPPPSAELRYNLTITSAAGIARGAGTSALSWQLQDGRYAVRVARRYGADGAPEQVHESSSAGDMDDRGIAPDALQEQREGDPKQLVSQEQTSTLMLLAAIAAARTLQRDEEIALYLNGAPDAGKLVLKVLGVARLDSPLGRLTTWHLAQTGGGLELWLAPAYHWMPVQIRSTGRDGVVATESIKAIAVP